MVMVEKAKKTVFCENLGMGRKACTEDFESYVFKDKKGKVFGSSQYGKVPGRDRLIEDSKQMREMSRNFSKTAKLFLKKEAKERRPSAVNLEDIKTGKIRKGWYKIIGIPNGRVRVFADGTYHVAIKNKDAHKIEDEEDDDKQLTDELKEVVCARIVLSHDEAIKVLDEKKIYGDVRNLLGRPGKWEGISFEYDNNRISAVRLTSKASSDTTVVIIDKTGGIGNWYIQRANTVEPDEE